MKYLVQLKRSLPALLLPVLPALTCAQEMPDPMPEPKPYVFVEPPIVDFSEMKAMALADLKVKTMPMPKLAPMMDRKEFAFFYQGAPQKADAAYNRGMHAIDQRRWEEAIDQLRQVTGEKADGAMYWVAYSQAKLGRRDEALASLDNLKKTFPNSRWLNDAAALGVEVRQMSGQSVPPDSPDDDIKLMALNGLMSSDPERALPILQKMLTGSQSPKVKERAIFVLAQSDSPKAREIMVQLAKGGGNPDVQRMAVRNLGIKGSKESRQLLADLYQGQTDVSVKREILRAFMVSGDREHLAVVAKTEKDPALRREAIRQMGASGDSKSLAEMYTSESDSSNKMEIANALMVAGAAQSLIDIAGTEKDPNVRRKVIQLLGVMGRDKTGAALVQIYSKETERGVKSSVLQGLFIQGNAPSIIEIARKESDPELRRDAVRLLSQMRTKESTDFLMEILNK